MQRPEEMALAPPLAQGEHGAGTRKTRSREAAGGASQGAPKGRRRNPHAEEERRADARPTHRSARSAPAGNKADAPPQWGRKRRARTGRSAQVFRARTLPRRFCRSGPARYEARTRPAPSRPCALGMLKPSAPGSKGPVQKVTVWYNMNAKEQRFGSLRGPRGMRRWPFTPSLSYGSLELWFAGTTEVVRPRSPWSWPAPDARASARLTPGRTTRPALAGQSRLPRLPAARGVSSRGCPSPGEAFGGD